MGSHRATTAPPDRELRSGGRGGPTSLTGALPVTTAVLLLLALALLLFPGLRRQFELSVQRRPDHFVELYFADQTAARACPVVDGRAPVTAVVRSHLGGAAALPWAVTVTRPGGGAVHRATGTAATRPGRATTIATTVAVPATAYTVAVTLPGRSESLAVHCPAPGAGP